MLQWELPGLGQSVGSACPWPSVSPISCNLLLMLPEIKCVQILSIPVPLACTGYGTRRLLGVCWEAPKQSLLLRRRCRSQFCHWLWICHSFKLPLLWTGLALSPGEGEGGQAGPSVLARGGKSSGRTRRAQTHREMLCPPVSRDRSYGPCLLDMSSLGLPRHRSTLSLVVGNNFIRSSPASLCFLVCMDGSIIKCNTNVFSVFLPHLLGFLDVP